MIQIVLKRYHEQFSLFKSYKASFLCLSLFPLRMKVLHSSHGFLPQRSALCVPLVCSATTSFVRMVCSCLEAAKITTATATPSVTSSMMGTTTIPITPEYRNDFEYGFVSGICGWRRVSWEETALMSEILETNGNSWGVSA